MGTTEVDARSSQGGKIFERKGHSRNTIRLREVPTSGALKRDTRSSLPGMGGRNEMNRDRVVVDRQSGPTNISLKGSRLVETGGVPRKRIRGRSLVNYHGCIFVQILNGG